MSSSAPSALPRLSRAWRWSLGVGLGVVAALSLVLLFMLAQGLWISRYLEPAAGKPGSEDASPEEPR